MLIDHHMMNYPPQPIIQESSNEYYEGFERQNIMTIKRPNLLESIKEKCLNRLSKKRHEKISRFRSEIMKQQDEGLSQCILITINNQQIIEYDSSNQDGYDYTYYSCESSQQEKIINQHVYNEIINENIVNEIMHEELNNLPEMSIEEWNDEYRKLQDELNQYLVKRLLESCQNDPILNYQKNVEFSKQQIEQLAQVYDPNNNSFYICAICKRYVYRVGTSKVQCERPGCLDIDVRCSDFKLEDLMNMILKVVLDHRQGCEDQGEPCCSEEKYVKVKVALLSESGLDHLSEDDGVDSLAIFVTCDKCGFFDFVTLY